MTDKGIFKKIKRLFAAKPTVSIVIVLVFLTLALASIFVSPQLYQWSLHEGDISLKNVYAPYDFSYQWEVNDEETLKARDAAIAKIPQFLRRDAAEEAKVKTALDDYYAVLAEPSAEGAVLEARIAVLKDKTGIDIGDKNAKVLFEYPDRQKLRDISAAIIKNIFTIGYVDDAGLDAVKAGNSNKVVIVGEGVAADVDKRSEELLSKKEVKSVIDDFAAKELSGDKKPRSAVAAVVAGVIAPNVKIDDKRFAQEKEAALKKVEPVHNVWTVKKNELIVEKGKRISERHIVQIAQLRTFLRPGRSVSFFFGVLLLFLLLGMVGVIDLSFPKKMDVLKSPKALAIVFMNMLFMLVAADLVMRSPQPSYFIPLEAMAMLLTLLIGVNTAFLSAVLMSILIAVLLGGKIEIALVLIVGCTVGISVVRDARRRSVILWAGVLVGVAKFMGIVCVGLINSMEMDFYVSDGLWGIASGIFSAFIVMGILPLFEFFFKVPTNISLLELSDLNHPLLKSLAMEAPGTYHHSIMVGNLAESACEVIGANSLLARVGAYYHDIGKVTKPEYFSENEMGSGSRHSNLAPSMSALIISKHVKDGADIARKYKLNSAIIDLITQHHGDSMISYFYQKAIERSDDGTVLNEEDFRYPGPKPQTKEGAIILLADSVEASSRALEDPTPSSITNLVRKIINNKFIDGQLDDCDLTLRDMNKIADCFVRVLMAVFHTRLNYPEETKKGPEVISNGDKSKLRKPKR